MKLETLIEIKNAMEAASDDATRYSICGVLVQPADGGKTRITATDGAVLVDVYVEDDFLTGKAFISRDDKQTLNAAITYLKKNKHIEAKAVGDCIEAGNYKIPLDRKIEYPAFENILKQKEPEFEYGIDLDKLSKIVDSMRRTKKNAIVKLSFTGKQSPIVVSVTGETKTALVMPCRI